MVSRGAHCEAIDLGPVVQKGSLRYLKRLRVFLQAFLRVTVSKTDVVHCITGSFPNLLANALPLLAARLSGKASLLSVVGADVPQAVESGTRLRQRLVGILLSWPSRVIACNTENEIALRKLGIPTERITLLSNALPLEVGNEATDSTLPEAFAAFASLHQPVLLSITARSYVYGAMESIRAFVELRRSFPQLGLVLIFKRGREETEFSAEFNAFIEDHRLTEHVLTLEDVPDVMPLLHRVDLFVRTPHTDGDSLSVREALAVGLPVVASAVGYRPPGTVLFEPGNSVDLQKQIERVLMDPNPRQRWQSSLDSEGELNLKRLLLVYQQLVAPDVWTENN